MRFKGWLWLAAFLIAINVLLGLFGRQWRFDSILIHHSAGAVGDLDMIRAMHKRRGWSDAAYHLILSNGSTSVPAGFLQATSHFQTLDISGATRNKLANVRSLHLCIVGNYDQNDVPEQLKPALAHALIALCDEFSIPHGKVIFHRDVNNTACPGKHLIKDEVLSWLENLAESCPDSIKKQQLETIASSSLSLSNYPHGLLMIQAMVSFMFLLIWFGLLLAFRPQGRRPRKLSPSRRSSRLQSRSPRKKPRKNRHI